MLPGRSPPVEPILLAGRYRVRRKLGSGSRGSVYLAEDETSGANVALKVLRAGSIGRGGLENVQAEFRALSSLRHPQIAAAYDFGYTDEGLPYYTREYIEGEPLAPRRPDGRMGAEPVLAPILDLLDALHYLHGHDILHLDVHAGNVIVASDPARGCVLIDFGLPPAFGARGSSLPLELRSTMAPELAAGGRVGPEADIYAVGRLLAYRITGSSGRRLELPGEIPGWGVRLTLDIERIAEKAMRERAASRFRSAAEFREALFAALGKSRGRPVRLEPREVTFGREAEIGTIEQALQQATTGAAAGIWFQGEPGLGKSRLLAEARWRAQLRGLDVIEVRFLEGAAARPAMERALRAVARRRRSREDWLEPLEPSRGGSTLARAEKAAAACFLVAGAPLVLLFDGVEHANRESRALVEALFRRAHAPGSGVRAGRGVAVFAGATEAPAASAPPRRAGALSRLRPLPRRAAVELLAALLRPLDVGRSALARFARLARGVPQRLREIAGALQAEIDETGAVPRNVRLERLGRRAVADGMRSRTHAAPERRILDTLAVLERPATAEEVATAGGIALAEAKCALRRLRRDEVVSRHRRGRLLAHLLADRRLAARLRCRLPARARFAIHGRMVRRLRRKRELDAAERESLAVHLLHVGPRAEARQAATAAALALSKAGLGENAIGVLERARATERALAWKMRFAEEISNLHHERGDHELGAALLAPICAGDLSRVEESRALSLRRRLAVHLHRSGRAEEALALFAEVRRLARLPRDAEELIIIESEIAELQTLRGRFPEADEACRRGLGLLQETSGGSPEFRGSMEVVLRASRGHLELRRLNLAPARRELELALRLAGRFGTPAVRASILNNLGIVHNNRSDFARAERCYEGAARLLARLGDERGLVHATCNLATIAAKRGDAVAARSRIETARQLLRRFPGERLEFVVELARGMTAHFLGDAGVAAAAFEKAIALGREGEDVQFIVFARIYLAEAHILCGRFGEAAAALREAERTARRTGLPLFERLIRSRELVLHALSGHEHASRKASRRLAELPPCGAELLEAWCDLWRAAARWLAGSDPAAHLERAHDVFSRLGVGAGVQLARIGLLLQALRGGEPRRLRARIALVEAGQCTHSFVRVLAPLALAEAYFALGDIAHAEACVQEAAGSIVGLPFLELDGRIEVLRARLASRRGERERARGHVHRGLSIRDLLARHVPARVRGRFLGHARFRALDEAMARLQPPLEVAPRPVGDEGGIAGMVGRSPAILEVFRAMERLSGLELPVLITGETGSGKDLAARALHEIGPRGARPFFALHCGSLPSELLESELFGHEPGAFTGADEARPGLLEHLDGGTLLLDELDSLLPPAQGKLLRVLEAGRARRLGGVEARPVNVRFLASTSADPAALLEAGALRRDLYFRLSALTLHLPPLRDRAEDIVLLARHFLALHAARLERPAPVLREEVVERLRKHTWPGNVRELENVILRLLVTASPGAALDLETLEAALPRLRAAPLFGPELIAGRSIQELRAELDRSYLRQLFREKGGDVKAMAGALEMRLSNVYDWLRRVKLDVRTLRREL